MVLAKAKKATPKGRLTKRPVSPELQLLRDLRDELTKLDIHPLLEEGAKRVPPALTLQSGMLLQAVVQVGSTETHDIWRVELMDSGDSVYQLDYQRGDRESGGISPADMAVILLSLTTVLDYSLNTIC